MIQPRHLPYTTAVRLLAGSASRGISRPWGSGLGAAKILDLRRGVKISKVWQKHDSYVAEQEKMGHISVGANESLLFFDNLFPLRIGNFLRWLWQTDQELSSILQRFNSNSKFGPLDPIGLVKTAIPASVPLKVTEIIPRLKEGGAFVKFSHAPKTNVGQLEDDLVKMLQENPISPWFNPFRGITAGLIKGTPWLEDMHRLPQTRLRVEFVPEDNSGSSGSSSDLSQEALYTLFRKYGKILDIISQEADSKVLPRFAYVDFVSVRDAIMARNCLHGFVVSGTTKTPIRLRLSYEKRRKTNALWTWVTTHPRVVIPVLAALLAAITVIIFDPIRQFFIRLKIQQAYKVDNNRIVKWFKSQTTDIMSTFGNLGSKKSPSESALNAMWMHRRNLVDQVRAWLAKDADTTFIVVQGPRGSGKRELVLDEVLKDRRNVLVVDCKAVAEGRGESGTISKLAAAVGYRPVFSWLNGISSYVDLAIQGTTGVKSGFSETLESQVVKILQTTAAALKDVALGERSRAGPAAAQLADDDFLDAHPEHRPVVVIANFVARANSGSALVYDRVADWAALLTASKVAHVIFLTEDASYSKALSRVQPNRDFRQISLGDLTPDVAKKYVVTRLQNELAQQKKSSETSSSSSSSSPTKSPVPLPATPPDLTQLDKCIEIIGGRRTDLDALVSRLKNGQPLPQATDSVVEQAAADIAKVFLSPSDSTPRHWSRQQAWHLIKHLATTDEQQQHSFSSSSPAALEYSTTLLSPIFDKSISSPAASAEDALASLADAELVALSLDLGQPRVIRPGKPIYAAAFRTLIATPYLRARMDYLVLDELVAIHNKAIAKAESELAVLGTLPKQPPELADRVRWLLADVEKAQGSITKLKAEMDALKKSMSSKKD